MKRFASVLLAVVLMLSLSVFAFADTLLVDIPFGSPAQVPSSSVTPYSLTPLDGDISILTSRSDALTGSWVSLVNQDGLFVGSGAILSYVGSPTSSYQNAFFVRRNEALPFNSPYYWWNFIGKITDANGYVITSSDISFIGIQRINSNGSFAQNQGVLSVASDNAYSFDDGYIQLSVSDDGVSSINAGYALYVGISNSSVVSPLSFEVEKFEMYSGESSSTVPPFTFGDGAHSTTPPAPEVRDPNDASQYGSAQDQVQWYNDAFGGAVDPELDDKINVGNDMLLQQEEIEQDVIADFQQYSSQVDPANITFPTAVLNGMSFIGTTFMSSYNNLGDISFVISLSMMIGVVLVLIGRGEGALARGMSASSRERRRTEYASERDMKKGG